MSKIINKSIKIVSQATTVFDEAITKVVKANDLLNKGIDLDSEDIASKEKKMMDLAIEVKDIKSERERKHNLIHINGELIESLKKFSTGS